jgi:hypothetical protein
MDIPGVEDYEGDEEDYYGDEEEYYEAKGFGPPPRRGPLAQDYYGQDYGPGEYEDAESPEPNEPKRKYYWRNEMLDYYLDHLQEAGWQGMPKGWDEESVKKFAKSLRKGGAKKEGFFDACVKKMEDEKGFNKDRAKRFCAGIKDEVYGSTYWRGKGKSEEEAAKDVKKHQNEE